MNVDADTQAILDDYGIELGGSDSSDPLDSPKTVSSDRSSGISCFTKSCLIVASTGGHSWLYYYRLNFVCGSLRFFLHNHR